MSAQSQGRGLKHRLHAEVPFGAAVIGAMAVVLVRRSAPGRVPVNADSVCADIGRRYQSLRSSVIALCSGEAHPATFMVAKATCTQNTSGMVGRGLATARGRGASNRSQPMRQTTAERIWPQSGKQ